MSAEGAEFGRILYLVHAGIPDGKQARVKMTLAGYEDISIKVVNVLPQYTTILTPDAKYAHQAERRRFSAHIVVFLVTYDPI